MRAQLRRCDRCSRRLRNLAAAEDWNVIVEYGVITELICPGCQTAAEYAEAAIHEATLTYHADAAGRLYGTPKAVSDV